MEWQLYIKNIHTLIINKTKNVLKYIFLKMNEVSESHNLDNKNATKKKNI